MRIDIAITGGLLGLTRRIHADADDFDPSERAVVMEATHACLDAVPMPIDGTTRDDRTIRIEADGRSIEFAETSAPSAWSRLVRTLSASKDRTTTSYGGDPT
jgi:hypothetical protein